MTIVLFVIRTTSPRQDTKKCSTLPPNIQDRAYYSFVALAHVRVHGEKGIGDGRARGAEVDSKKTLEQRDVT